MIKLSTEATALLILAVVVVSTIGLAYVFLSPPSVKRKRFVAFSWLSLPVSTMGVFLMNDSLTATVAWFICGVAITAFNVANTFICPKCGAYAATWTAKQSARLGKCSSCGFQIDQKVS